MLSFVICDIFVCEETPIFLSTSEYQPGSVVDDRSLMYTVKLRWKSRRKGMDSFHGGTNINCTHRPGARAKIVDIKDVSTRNADPK